MGARMGCYPETKSNSPSLEGIREIDRHPSITPYLLLLSSITINFDLAQYTEQKLYFLASFVARFDHLSKFWPVMKVVVSCATLGKFLKREEAHPSSHFPPAW